jgi:uncharacterized MAPEG superfamily protein
MTPEVTALALSGLLLLAQFLHVSVLANLELGSRYFTSPRDRAPDRELSVRTARLKRAYENHREWIVPFAIAVAVVQMAGANSGFTAACAWVYVAARLAYVPAYALGWSPWRSAIWAVGFFATLAMLVAALI